MQSGVADKLTEALPDIAEQLPAALVSGGEIQIPIADYLSHIANTEIDTSLADHLRVEGEDYTRATAKDYIESHAEELKNHVDKAVAEHQVDDAFKTSVDSVKSIIKDQLDTASHFDSSVNDAYASLVAHFFAVHAQKLDTTPEALYQQYPLKVDSQLSGGQVFNQTEKTAVNVTARWQKALKSITATNTEGSVHFDMPSILKEFGESGKTLPFPIKVLRQVFNKHKDIPKDVIANLPSLIANPLYVYAHKDGGINIAIEAVTAQGEPIVVGVREGRIRTITPLHHSESSQGNNRLLTVFSQSKGLAYARNEKAFTEAKAFVPVTGWDNSNGHKVRTRKSIITNDDLVKKYGENFYQGTNNRGTFSPSTNTITLLKNADLSTFLHETGHFFLEVQFDIAARMTQEVEALGATPGQQAILDDTQALLNWFGVDSLDTWFNFKPLFFVFCQNKWGSLIGSILQIAIYTK